MLLAVISDCLIFIAYVSIPLQIVIFLWSSGITNEVLASPSKLMIVSVAVLFTLFTLLCGITHLFTAFLEFQSMRAPDALTASKIATAIVSIATAVVMYMLMPMILDMLKIVEIIRKGRLQEMSRLMRLVTEHCTEVIATHSVDQTLRFLSVNGASESCFRQTPEMLIGTSFYSIICEEDLPRVKSVVEDVMRRALHSTVTDLSATRMEYRVRTSATACALWMESNVSIAYEDMQPLIIIITRDITNRRAMEAQRRLVEEQERENTVVTAKLQFIACTAHDLKTPLASFRMALDLLQTTELSSEQRALLTQASVCVELMKLTIAQAMDLGKATTGKKLEPRRTTVELDELIQHCHVVIQGYARQVPIRSHIDPRICVTIVTDKEWIWQMIMNFVTNACKFTEKGGIDILLELSDDDTMLLCKVVDTGIGVRPEAQPLLFNPFSEIQKSQNDGTGIGLWSVKLHCEGLGGSCGMYSNPNALSGSVFWFKIPYRPDFSDIAHERKASRTPPLTDEDFKSMSALGPSITHPVPTLFDSPTSPSSNERNHFESFPATSSTPPPEEYVALIVDDTRSIRRLVGRALERAGFHRVEEAENGRQALERMQKSWYSIVFCDYSMPIMTGPEAVRRFRSWEETAGRNQRQLIVAMSANTEQSDVNESVEAGFDGFLPKPLDLLVLSQLLNKFYPQLLNALP